MIMKGDLTYSFYRIFFLLLKSILLLTLKKKFDLIFSYYTNILSNFYTLFHYLIFGLKKWTMVLNLN